MHGHNPVLSEKILEWAMKLEGEAKAAGAESMNVMGVCCTGNELVMRHGVPLAAHNQQSELLLATGAVDVMVVDIQCIWPSLPQVAACFDTAFVTTDEMVHIPGARHIEFEAVHADESAQKVVRLGIEAFKKRRGKKVDIPNIKSAAMAGFSVEAIAGVLSKVDPADPLKPVIDNLASGNILGFAGVVGCSSIKFRDGEMTERMVMELLAHNVLVVTTGCTAHICGQAGLLTPAATERYCGDGLRTVLTALGEAAGFDGPLPPVWHMGSVSIIPALSTSWPLSLDGLASKSASSPPWVPLRSSLPKRRCLSAFLFWHSARRSTWHRHRVSRAAPWLRRR